MSGCQSSRAASDKAKKLRKIANELGCNEATVRRDLDILDLPPDPQAAIREGDSAEKYLNAALLQETGIDRSARNKIGRRRREGEKTGKHSGPLAGILLDWLLTKRLTNSNTVLVLEKAVGWTKSLPNGQPKAESQKFGEVVASLERDRQRERRLKSPELDLIELEQCTSTLVRALILVESVHVIRQSALKKAIAEVEARGHWTDRPEWKKEQDKIAERRNLRGGNQT